MQTGFIFCVRCTSQWVFFRLSIRLFARMSIEIERKVMGLIFNMKSLLKMHLVEQHTVMIQSLC